MAENIRMLVEEAAKIYGKKTFVYYKEQEVSFQALNDLTNKTANAFLAGGIKRGDRVAIMLLNRPEFLYVWFGLNKIGASMVPLNTALTAYEVEYQLNNSESKLVVTDKDHYGTVNKASVKCPSLREIILLDSDTKMEKTELFENFIRDQPIELREFEVNINDEAAILYTSGTTGNPKGCIADQFYYLNAGRAYVREQIITSKDRILTPLPLFHMNAQTISTMVGLLSGASLILLDRFHPSTWWDDIKKYKANIFHYLGVIPSILMSLPERKDDYNDNTLYGVGAGVLKDIHEKFEKRFNVRLLEIYGSTEAGGVFLTRRGLKDRKVGTGCFGRVFPEAEAMIVDDDDRELPVGLSFSP